MSQRVKTIADRVQAFSNEVVAYVEGIAADDWAKTCEWETWPVGATARHIGQHFGIFELAALIVDGKPLPQWSMDDINAMSHKDSKAHADGTKMEALENIMQNSAGMISFLSQLGDADLDKSGSMPAFSGEVTTEQLIDFVIFQSAAQHLSSIKAAVGG